MLHFFRLLILLINIDQETVLNWFGLETPNNKNTYSQITEKNYNLSISGASVEPSSALSLNTLKLIIEGLWEKVQDGLTLADIENIMFFVLFIRFIILAIKYNLKTSFYITCIGLFAGYLWYRHLIDLISMYRGVLLKIPFLNKFGFDAIQLRSLNRQLALTDLRLNENIHWYNPGQLIYYAFIKGVVNINEDTGVHTYIDPLSMIISNLKDSHKAKILPAYYKIYNIFLPKIFEMFSKFWAQLSGVAGYAIITRIGKKYCPYLVRWHWTFLLIIGMVEQIVVYFIYRAYYFQSYVLVPQLTEIEESSMNDVVDLADVVDVVDVADVMHVLDKSLLLQINLLDGIISGVVFSHIGLILFGLFHAIWGQYFYFPFFVENTELHIGTRPRNSIYSGGNTAWQDPTEKEKTLGRILPKFWYGWFGRGTKTDSAIVVIYKRLKNTFNKLKKVLKKKFN